MSDERRNVNDTVDNDEVLQWVTFKLDSETYGINVMQVQEVLRYSEIAPAQIVSSKLNLSCHPEHKHNILLSCISSHLLRQPSLPEPKPDCNVI